ncbi:MAG: hypothetical protein M1816_000368 [Peltula sp. TS41687]|nr:MAG: hypothetical protein M1816_000368 [Peltula sp. TS41687]
MPAKDMAHPRRFRTYPVRELASANRRIWEAACATTAAPTFGEEGRAKEVFILMEASDVTIPRISIGTGHPGTIGLSTPDNFPKVLSTKLIGVLKSIATDCESAAHDLNSRIKELPNFYFRFNATHGLGAISLEEWEKMGDVAMHTKAYMEAVPISTSIDAVVDLLCKPSGSAFSLGNICGIPNTADTHTSVRVPIRSQPTCSRIVTGRQNILRRLENFLEVRQGGSQPRREYLLYGMGGAGKTQLALKFAEDNQHRTTIEQSHKDVSAGYTPGSSMIKVSAESAIQWLGRLDEEWLLLFDNAEDPQLVSDFVPSTDRGNILMPYCHIDEMETAEAVTLLLKAARLEETSKELRQSTEPIVRLGCLALAIDQAGAYIAMGRCSINDYQRTFRNHRKKLLENTTYKGASRYNQAVYTTWDMSYEKIETSIQETSRDLHAPEAAKSAVQILSLFTHFHNESLMEEILKRAAEAGQSQDDSQEEGEEDKVKVPLQLLQLDGDGIWDPFYFREGASILLSYSRIKPDQTGGYYSMHLLVHSWAQDRLASTGSRKSRTCCKGTIIRVDYVDLFAQRIIRFGVNFFHTLEHANSSIMLERVLGQEHPDTLSSMANLASTYSNQGRRQEAEELEVEVLEARKRVLGQEHPDSLTSMASLASTYRDQVRSPGYSPLVCDDVVCNADLPPFVVLPAHPEYIV